MKKDALAVKKPTVLGTVVRNTGTLMKQVATILTKDLQPPELAMLHANMREWADNLEELKKNAHDRLLDVAIKQGVVTTEAGSRECAVDGWSIGARPRSTGYDDKKVELLLRAKGIDVANGMTPTIKYKADVERLKMLAAMNKLTPDELETCRAELKFNLVVKET